MLISYGEYSKGPLDYVPWEVKARTAIHFNTMYHTHARHCKTPQDTATYCTTLKHDTTTHDVHQQ